MAEQPDDSAACENDDTEDEERQVGRPSPTSMDDLLTALDDVLETTGGPIATTNEVAERVEIRPRTVRQKLSELVDEGRVGSRKVGSGRVWWPVDQEEDTEASDE